ncbi:hypothetical protein ACFVU3_28905 [Streptomyces sp. NPDC058052]|uniref:hypothetical protein n=1 Tax=Streptomyces sp. NPDC058052 TaxID=3346316 RepID=UPI0036EB149D
MVGLGGVENCLLLLIWLFGFVALSGVILENAMSMVVVLFAPLVRVAAVPAAVNLFAGSLLGAWA